jgi:hypothetical protein
MSDPSPPGSRAASGFFDNYLRLLEKHAIPARQRRWYVKHVEDFIKTQNGRWIKLLSGADLTSYLDVIGRQNRFSGWQFSQRIAALGILYCELLCTPACKDVCIWGQSGNSVAGGTPGLRVGKPGIGSFHSEPKCAPDFKCARTRSPDNVGSLGYCSPRAQPGEG